MLPKKRKFKEIHPDDPAAYLVGNKFAAKPPEQQQNKTITVYVTADEKKKCEEAAKLRGVKVTPWSRQVLLAEADKVKAEPHDATKPN